MGYPIVALRQRINNTLDPGFAVLRGWLQNPVVRNVLLLLLLVVVLLYPAGAGSTSVDAATRAFIWMLLAMGLNIVVGFAGLLDLGYAAFYAIGAYMVAFFASTHFSVAHHHISNSLLSYGPEGIHVNIFLMIPIAAGAAAFCGVVFGAPTLRLRGDYLAIVTLGFGEIVPKVITNLGPDNSFGWPNITNGVNRITGIDSPPDIRIFGFHFTFASLLDPKPWYYFALILVVFSVFIIMSLRESRLGRAWAAIREDEIAAAHMGINITRTRLLAFGLGAAFSGFAGLIQASRVTSVDATDFQFSFSITILLMVIIGGMGSIPGVLLGAALLSYLDLTWLATINSKVNDFGALIHTAPGPIGAFGSWVAGLNLLSAKPLVFGIILLVVMLLRPQGLWPSSTRARELQPETEQVLEEEQEQLYTVRTE